MSITYYNYSGNRIPSVRDCFWSFQLVLLVLYDSHTAATIDHQPTRWGRETEEESGSEETCLACKTGEGIDCLSAPVNQVHYFTDTTCYILPCTTTHLYTLAPYLFGKVINFAMPNQTNWQDIMFTGSSSPQSLLSEGGAPECLGMRLNNPIESGGSHLTFYTHSTAKYGFRPPGNVTCTPYTMCMLNTKSANTLLWSTWLLGLSPPPPPTHTHTHTRTHMIMCSHSGRMNQEVLLLVGVFLAASITSLFRAMLFGLAGERFVARLRKKVLKKVNITVAGVQQ